jgi:nucleoside-diphosphate-sugar epimerase
MKYLITGGCGFIGSHIAEELVEEKHEVIVYDDLSSGYEKNIAHIKEDVHFIKADIRDAQTLDKSMAGVDYVFHEAALVSVFDSVDRPIDNNEINITGTLNVLNAARNQKVKRVVMASSAAVYGEEPTLPKKEDMKLEPISPYALAKVTGEYYLSAFANLYGLEAVALRYFNVYGPRQDPSSMYSGVISKFTEDFNTDQQPTIYGDGKQSRDFVYVKDVVAANMAAMLSKNAGRGEVFNIALGEQISLLNLIDVFGKIKGKTFEPVFKEVRKGDIRHSLADISLAKKVLGYTPQYSLLDGIKALLDYIE